MQPSHARFRIMAVPGGAQFSVKVVPNASRDRILGVWNEALRLSVSAPPEAGKANAAVVRLLADVLGRRPADIQIVAGPSQPLKWVQVHGMTGDEIRTRLAAAFASNPVK